MVFSDALTKAGRLVELQHIFWRNPRRVLATSEPPELRGQVAGELAGAALTYAAASVTAAGNPR